jgi:REP element-mobilizing transposase RayT
MKKDTEKRKDDRLKSVLQFRGVDPWNAEAASLKRRHLPHLVATEATYFVTFRARLFLPPSARKIILEEIRTLAADAIELDAAVVMPDHVHLIFRLADDADLSRVLKLLKGRSARRINQMLEREGAVWMDESFDHVIRNEDELRDKLEYIKQNPVKKGLVKHPEDYKWLLISADASSDFGDAANTESKQKNT